MPLAAVMPGPDQPVELREFPSPTVERGGILLETIYSEVCGTDVHLQKGQLAGVPYPIIPGHVSVGRVLETGGALHDIDGNAIVPGSVVTFLDVHETCYACYQCLVNQTPTRCSARRVYGVTYSAHEGLLGGWSQQIYLKPGVKAVVLPDHVSPERFSAGGCGLPTAVHAIERAQIRLGDAVVVQGAGPVGISAAMLAILSGAGPVIIIDQHALRVAGASEFGVDAALRRDPQNPQAVIDEVLRLTGGRGADVTIEATGVPAAVPEGIAMTRDGGRYVIVGHYSDTGSIPINPHTQINKKHLEIRGVWGTAFHHFHHAVGILARHGGKVADGRGFEHMISKTYKLGEIMQALDDVEHGRVLKALVAPNA